MEMGRRAGLWAVGPVPSGLPWRIGSCCTISQFTVPSPKRGRAAPCDVHSYGGGRLGPLPRQKCGGDDLRHNAAHALSGGGMPPFVLSDRQTARTGTGVGNGRTSLRFSARKGTVAVLYEYLPLVLDAVVRSPWF